jgi:hypothetical protein
MPRIHGAKPSDVYNVLDLGYRYSYEFVNHVRAAQVSGASTWCTLTNSNSAWFDTLTSPPPVTTTTAPTNPPATTAAPTNPPTTTAAPTNPPTTTAAPTKPPTTTAAPTNPPTTTAAPTNPPTTTAPTNPPTTTARPPTTTVPPSNYPAGWYTVTLTTPSFGSSTKEIYDGKGWLFVPYEQKRTANASDAYYVMNTPYYNFHGPINPRPKTLLEMSTRIEGVEAPYTAYRGFYKKANADTNKTDLYNAHGCHKKRKGGKKGGMDKGAKNIKKLNEAYKDEYKKTKDVDLALEAMFRMECTFTSHEKETLWTPALIKSMMMEKACAAGGCHDPCYRITKGKNAKKRNKKYLKKHGGKYPKSYTASLNATEGTVPEAVLLEHLSFAELYLPEYPRVNLKRSSQQIINP